MKPGSSTIPPQIVDEASEWLVTMRDPGVSAQRREAFADWLRVSPMHVRAYLEVAALWSDAARISRSLAADPGSPVGEMPNNVVPLPVAGVFCEKSSPNPRPARGRVRWAAAVAAIVACVAGAITFWVSRQFTTYTTDIGEGRAITLKDGSFVRLNSHSKLRVRLSERSRDLYLLEGQALFEVAKDPARPFIVHTAVTTVRAVGTVFDINRRSSDTVVTVIEGHVLVDPARGTDGDVVPLRGEPQGASRPPRNEIALSAGEQATVSGAGAVAITSNANLAAATSWIQQALVFDGATLDTVIEELNRYSPKEIVLADPSLASLRINAVFHSTSPDALLRFLRRLKGVEVDGSGPEIRVYRSPVPIGVSQPLLHTDE